MESLRKVLRVELGNMLLPSHDSFVAEIMMYYMVWISQTGSLKIV